MKQVPDRLHQAALRLFAEKGVTQVTVTDLAQAAGVARGTVYKHFETVESLFEQVATKLTNELAVRVLDASSQVNDPALRVANGIRFFVRRSHEEPAWGRFLVRFGASTSMLRELLEGFPMREMKLGIEIGRFQLRPEQITGAVGVISGSVLAAMSLVLEGHKTWREAGSDIAELCLRALGVPFESARELATAELPPLPPAPEED